MKEKQNGKQKSKVRSKVRNTVKSKTKEEMRRTEEIEEKGDKEDRQETEKRPNHTKEREETKRVGNIFIRVCSTLLNDFFYLRLRKTHGNNKQKAVQCKTLSVYIEFAFVL